MYLGVTMLFVVVIYFEAFEDFVLLLTTIKWIFHLWFYINH
jgi:hypothetical protein